MGALFQQMKNRNIEFDKTPFTFTAEESLHSVMMKAELEEASRLNSELATIIEGYRIGLEDNNNKLVYEAIGDFRKVMDENLKRQIKTFKKILKNSLSDIEKKYKALKALCVKYDHQMVDGTKYTKGHIQFNLNGKVDTRFIQEYVFMIQDHLYQIKQAREANISTVYSRCLNEVSSKEYLDNIRGKILNTVPTTQGEFHNACMDYFFGGKPRMQIITINTNVIFALYKTIAQLSVVISDIKDDIEDVKSGITDLKGNLDKKDDDILDPWRKSDMPSVFGDFGYEEFLSHCDKATIKYISKAIATLKEIWLIYKVYFSCKIEVLNSAIRNYTNIIRAAYIDGGASK